MKRIPAVFFALIILLLAACSANSTADPAAIAQAPAATFTPLTLPTATGTASPSAAAAPTQTPAPTHTATPVLPTATPTVAYTQDCITIEDQLPADLGAEGALLLYGGRYASDWNRTMFHFDLMSHRRSPLPYSAVELALSPDGRWLAYIQQGYDGLGRIKDRFLRVTDAEGRHLNLSYWGLNWQELDGWQDAEHLLLYVPGYPGGDTIILNPFTGQKEVLPLEIPGRRESEPWNGQWKTVPNPQLSHWVFPAKEHPPIWWLQANGGGGDALWKAKYAYYIVDTPQWAPNGEYFKILDSITELDPDSRQLFRVGVDGSAVPLTRAIGDDVRLSWSPDSRYLAGWVQLDPNKEYTYANHLVLVDAVTPQLTDLCFENQVPSDIGWVENAAPVWSPDGRYLAIMVSRIEKRSNSRYTQEILIWDTAIIDLQARRGYLLAKDARPQAWMRKP